jgi:PhzF family phenazine biosynthesis protein
MSAAELLVVRAFTVGVDGGNPAGVVLDADALTQQQKQAIAARACFPETAFVSRSRIATLKLEFFTPRRQIAHCGHATIAVFAHLNTAGALPDGLHSKETIDGVRAVRVAAGRAAMQQRSPVLSEAPYGPALDALRLRPEALAPELPPVVVDTGNRFLLAGVRTAGDLQGMAPHLSRLERLSEALDLVGAYVFTQAAEAPYEATARMFAPRYGIAEEAATGMAAGPLAGLLNLRGRAPASLLIEQGRFMAQPSPSRLEAELELDADGRIAAIWVAGAAAVQERRPLPLADAAA